MEQKIHPEDPVDREAVLHRPHFDLEALYLKAAESKRLDPFGEDELGTADAPNAADQISPLKVQIDIQQSIRGEDASSRACVHKDVVEHDVVVPIGKLGPNERQSTRKTDLTHCGCPTSGVR